MELSDFEVEAGPLVLFIAVWTLRVVGKDEDDSAEFVSGSEGSVSECDEDDVKDFISGPDDGDGVVV